MSLSNKGNTEATDAILDEQLFNDYMELGAIAETYAFSFDQTGRPARPTQPFG